MIIYINANGDVIEQEYTNIVQGDNNANEIYLIAPLPANAQPTINFTLPNGRVTDAYQMTRTLELNAGDGLNVWKKSIVDVPVTEYYGLVKFQIKIIINGSTVAVARGKFKVEEGNDWQLPPEPTQTVYTDILNALSAIAGDVLNKVDIDYTNAGQTIEQQIINNAYGLKFIKTVDEDTITVEIKTDGLYVDDVRILDQEEVENLFNQTAGRKYPLGSTSGTGEIFNDYVNNVASGDYSHAEGYKTTASGDYAHTEGNETSADRGSHAEGSGTEAGLLGDMLTSLVFAHAEGKDTKAIGRYSHAEGYGTQAGYLEEGLDNILYGTASHAEGYNTKALAGGHSEGSETIASGIDAHAEGSETTASGNYSHTEGLRTTASYYYAHAEGDQTTASGSASHAEGWYTTASDYSAHSEGSFTTASASNSHAGGGHSIASHNYAFVHGDTVASSANNQTVFGIANDDDSDALFIIGNGETGSGLTPEARIVSKSNAFVVKSNGDIYGGGNKQLSTKEYVDTIATTKQNVIDSSHKLNSDLVDDTNQTNKFVTVGEKSTWNAKQNAIDSSHKLSADLVDDTTTTNKFVTASEKAQITTNANDISDIEDLIPAQATSSNQLADINFVNSSIATNTATFRGTYNLVSDLSLTTSATESQISTALAGTISTADNNDYCFVQIPTSTSTPTEISRIDRYKFDGVDWEFEYSLNNSGFTASQWAAINSGITDIAVTQIGTNTSNIGTLFLDKVDSEVSSEIVEGGIVYLAKSIIDNDGNIILKIISNADPSEVYKELKLTPTHAQIDGNEIETQNNKVTSLSNSSTDTQYPSAKCVYDAISANKGIKQLNGISISSPINVLTDTEIGELYSCSGFIYFSSSNIYEITGDRVLLYRYNSNTVYIYSAIIKNNPDVITSNISGRNYKIVINNDTLSLWYSGIGVNYFNGTVVENTINSVYAPTSSGTSGYLLQSNGTGNAPTFAIEKATSISNVSTDSQVPTAKAVYDYIGSLNATEVSY